MLHGIMPTKAERKWMQDVARLGCIVCRIQNRGYVPCAVHHILDGSRRIGHLHTIGLCDPGHHQGARAKSGHVSRHPNKAEFERRYGTETFLLELTRHAIKEILPP